jgi:hypothetical protein
LSSKNNSKCQRKPAAILFGLTFTRFLPAHASRDIVWLEPINIHLNDLLASSSKFL